MEFVRVDDTSTEERSLEREWLTPALPAGPSRSAPSTKRGTASSMLAAAMFGLVDALGWERPKDETVEVADAPIGGDGLTLDYRHLEPLE